MDFSPSSLVKMRARVARTPLALPRYDAFEGLVKEQLIAWPKLSADRAASFIMSVWASRAAKAGRIRIPRSDLNWIVGAGKLCRWRLKGAERVWAQDLAAHLLRTAAATEAAADKPPPKATPD